MHQTKHVPLTHPERPTLVVASLFVIWTLLVSSSSPLIRLFDQAIIHCLDNHQTQGLIQFTRAITDVGSPKSATFLTILSVFILLAYRHFPEATFMALTMMVGNGYSWLLKQLVQRPRPSVQHLVYAGGYSFPSGHSIGSASLYGCLFIIFLILIRRSLWRRLLCGICLFMPLLIGYTRIYLHVHFPSDVLGGWLEGILFVLIGYCLLYYLSLVKHSR